MAKEVRILDDTVVNQIAAGEVVERPASVVKELVENSVDAGATEVTVSVVAGGRNVIEVIDNGSGLTKDNALLAVERFGTSKIRSADDLLAVETHGFRGEALPSIAAVSRFRLNSSTKDSTDQGVEIEIHGGRLRDVTDAQMAPGTRVQVRNLFFNVPARKKFLRSEGTETGLIRSILSDFAVAYPEVRFVLIVDGREVFACPVSKSFGERVGQLKMIRGTVSPVVQETQVEGASILVRAALGHPVQAVSGSGRLRLLVNRRSVRDRLLLRAVRDGYGNFLKAGKYPVGVLALDISPSEVDVNVHPQKTEVRFRSPNSVFAVVRQAVARSLSDIAPEYAMQSGEPERVESGGAVFSAAPAESMRTYYLKKGPAAYNETAFGDPGSIPLFGGGSGWSHSRSEGKLETLSSQSKLSSMRFVGQIFNLYLLLEGEQQFSLVDMHAAHERVRFYRLKSQFLEGQIVSQTLLLPETIEVPAERIEQFERFQSGFSNLGIVCERFGENCIIVRAMPALLGTVSAQEVFDDLFSLSEWTDWADVLEKRADDIIARLACHSSVRSGQGLSVDEVYALLEALEEAETAAFCPHGRPVAVFLSASELEAMFGRS